MTMQSTPSSGKRKSDLIFKWYKFSTYSACVLAWMSLGASNEILGPTLPDLIVQTNSNVQEMGKILTVRGAGLMLTPLASSLLIHFYPASRRFLLSFFVIAVGLLSIGISQSNAMWQIALLLLVQSSCYSVLVIAVQSTTSNLFGSSPSAFPLHGIQLGWGFGAVLICLFTSLLLGPGYSVVKLSCSNVNEPSTVVAVGTSPSYVSKVFLALGGFGVGAGLILLVFVFVPVPTRLQAERHSSPRDKFLPSAIIKGAGWIGGLLLGTVTLLYVLFEGYFGVLTRYLVFFSISTCRGAWISQSTAILQQLTLVVCFEVSRFLCGLYFTSTLRRQRFPELFLLVAAAVVALNGLLLPLVAYNSIAGLWVLVSIHGFAHAVLYTGITPWLGQFINVNATAASILILGSAMGNFFFMWPAAFILDQNSSNFLWLVGGVSIAAGLLTILVLTAGRIFENSSGGVEQPTIFHIDVDRAARDRRNNET